ncbi:MAG: hypothetical protein ABSG53_14400 [Thermoguttaceae bacterium]|jgi:hypothetical protein
MVAVKTPASEQFATGSRARAGAATFSLAPTPPFRLDLAVWTLRRRMENGVDRCDGTTYRRVLPLDGAPVEVSVTQQPDTMAQVESASGLPASPTRPDAMERI